MKLRFRANSLRLRVNQREVQSLAAGKALEEQVIFPGATRLAYTLTPEAAADAKVRFEDGSIHVLAPQNQITDWAKGDAIGLYFELPTSETTLNLAIEKDLECIDGRPEERDPNAFPRFGKNC